MRNRNRPRLFCDAQLRSDLVCEQLRALRINGSFATAQVKKDIPEEDRPEEGKRVMQELIELAKKEK